MIGSASLKFKAMDDIKACKGGPTLACQLKNNLRGQECQSCGLRLLEEKAADPHYGFSAWCPNVLHAPNERSVSSAVPQRAPCGDEGPAGAASHGRKRIRCEKPDHYRAQGSWELTNGNEVMPVIVILNTQKAYANLFARGQLHFTPGAERLARAMKVREKGVMELPEVELPKFCDTLNFQQGRHRTTALAQLGFAAYPAVCKDAEATRILDLFGAPASDAQENFDWSGIEYPAIGK